MKKGFYFIAANQEDKNGNTYKGIVLEEGSFELKGKLFVHRPNHAAGGLWKVSHCESGANICRGRTLSEARQIAKDLQGFQLWELSTWKELTDNINHNPEYTEELSQIKLII